MLPWSMVIRGQDTVNLWDIASCKVWVEVRGMAGQDTTRYRGVNTLCCEVRGCEVLLDVVLL